MKELTFDGLAKSVAIAMNKKTVECFCRNFKERKMKYSYDEIDIKFEIIWFAKENGGQCSPDLEKIKIWVDEMKYSDFKKLVFRLVK